MLRGDCGRGGLCGVGLCGFVNLYVGTCVTWQSLLKSFCLLKIYVYKTADKIKANVSTSKVFTW